MRDSNRTKVCSRFVSLVTLIIGVILLLSGRSLGYSPEMQRSFVEGPWELIVQTGREGQRFNFPVTVTNEDKPETLNSVLPVMGTPIEVKLVQYIPDLKWETFPVKQSGGGAVAKLHIRGTGIDQEMWLNSGDPARKSISSKIGSISIRQFHDVNAVEKYLQELTKPEAVGIISVQLEDFNSPLEYIANRGETIAIEGTKYRLTVLEYLPHYSIDMQTKKVKNISDAPINPALKIRFDDGENTYEKWLWSKLPSSPHEKIKLPVELRFSDFYLGNVEGKYILATTRGGNSWLCFSQGGKTRVEKAELKKPYPFADKEYFFNLEEIIDGAVIKTDWKNNSDMLVNPAIIATIIQGDIEKQIVLEFNKPYHHKTELGTIVLLYRRKPGTSETTN
ncbi:MAG: hypothetical protein ACYSUK_08125 [Planctomycetota bacterium]|jgi:hypothetical protein